MQDYRMAEYENLQYPGYNGHTLKEVGQNLMPDAISSSHITYSEVQEYMNGVLQKNTKFTNFASNPDRTDISYRTTVIKGQENTAYLPAIYFDNIGILYPDTEYQRGKISEESFYKDGLNLIKRKSYLYNDLNEGKGLFDYKYQNEIGFTSAFKKLRQYYLYQFIPYVNTDIIEIDYLNPNNSIISNSLSYKWNFDYNKKINVKSTITQNSKGETLTTEYQYPPDLTSGYEQSAIMQEMVNRNMIATPVITKSKNGSTTLSEQRTLYKYSPSTNGNLILPEFVYGKKGENTTVSDRKITYNSYDAQGNLTQYTLENGIPVSIIWGYNNQYPVAKIEGITLDEFDETSYFRSMLEDGNLSDDDNRYLREFYSSAMITTYTYKPLIGVTSITGPNGQTEYYNYDSANRLQSIVNEKQEVIKTFEYNYKQP
ncbi:MAG TPA: hypothetical protein DCR77_01670 [Flavobacteriaceae bacterium]|nr:hypothetical protein [Flavobacteriaceae bacterium]